MLRPTSLRVRLVLGVIVLAALGLAIADVATYASLRSFLLHRTDSTLEASHPNVESAALGLRRGEPEAEGGPGPGPAGVGGPGIDYYQVRTLSGRILQSRAVPQLAQQAIPPPPRLPAKIALPSRADAEGDRVAYFTVPAESGGGRYRVRAAIEVRAKNRILLIASSLGGVDGTLHRLVLIELLVTAAVLAALMALGLWVVRLGLRPLRSIEGTAAGIAAGDLTRRVEHADERTEVGRLGVALNAMLAQIESAFKSREASEQRAWQSEQKLRRFVADASHELRTPLAAVRAYAELFKRGAQRRPEDLARAMDGITRESERMSTLVEDLLLLARLDEGRPLQREPVRVDEVVTEAVETAQTVDPTRRIGLETEPVVVLGDRERLRQIVDNLLSNARAHTPADTPVQVAVAHEDSNAVIRVADEGPGMSADVLERVFERFYRADPTRSRASGGVGLGLSIVAAVAEAHGGSVDAHSEAGRGTTFRIVLPLSEQQRNGASAGQPARRATRNVCRSSR
ncbi:MAG TPA: HAMP domain-containing sensor histidine kinase [Gaiellaceae bacterium]|jgi:two-component system OmpR family sensor kinase|nr:HAMP domain-containing sensor histidine kinase [Gaiellaceae bacterium]